MLIEFALRVRCILAKVSAVILALQSSFAVHLGVDNLGVVRHVGRLLDGHRCSIPFELVKDGDLLLLILRGCFISGSGHGSDY